MFVLFNWNIVQTTALLHQISIKNYISFSYSSLYWRNQTSNVYWGVILYIIFILIHSIFVFQHNPSVDIFFCSSYLLSHVKKKCVTSSNNNNYALGHSSITERKSAYITANRAWPPWLEYIWPLRKFIGQNLFIDHSYQTFNYVSNYIQIDLWINRKLFFHFHHDIVSV